MKWLCRFDLDEKRVTIPSRIGQSLFAYLVLTAGTSHRREKLAGTFWPDTFEENARKNLRQELWRVRKVLSAQQNGAGNYLLADQDTTSFNRRMSAVFAHGTLSAGTVNRQNFIPDIR